MNDVPAVAAAVLAGGASRRMGRDKALVVVDGSPMVVRVVAAVTAAGCAPVVVVGGDRSALPALGLDRIDDGWPGEGPLGGIVTALRWAQGPVVVTACDLPYLTPAAVRVLLDAATASDRATGARVDVVVAGDDRLEPLLALWYPSATTRLERCFAAGERAVHRVLDPDGGAGDDRLAVRRVRVDRAALRNVNRPTDL